MPRVIKINHIGVATADLAQSLTFLSDGLGLSLTGSEDVPGDAVRVSFLPLGDTRLELLEPLGESGPVQKFLANRGPGVHHICLEVEDIDAALADMQAKGAAILDQQPRIAAEGRAIFLHPKGTNGVLLELVERDEA